jgi:predicted aconitase with swiveling domain
MMGGKGIGRMSKKFIGRVILEGNIEGQAVVTRQGFNTLASYYKSITGNAAAAICSDQDNRDLYQKDLTGKIICLPKSIGSTSAGATWVQIAEMGLAPKALLFSGNIDSLAAAGVALVDVWVGRRIVTIDDLGEEFLMSVQDGQTIAIDADGTVTLVTS